MFISNFLYALSMFIVESDDLICKVNTASSCAGMKQLGVEPSHVTLGILVKAGTSLEIYHTYF